VRDDAADVRDVPDVPPAVCGDGTRAGSEECDDGNLTAGDGCSATCTVEYCGDGLVGTLLAANDDFETGDLSRLGWVPGATRGFTVGTAHVHGGTYALGPGNIGVAGSTSTISLSAASDGRVCFWYAGESESCCDSFTFAVDGTTLLTRLGSYTTWTEFCTDVTSGLHTFTWSYSKDGSINTGWDAFYIDDVRVSSGRVEECDDGGTIAGDGCGPTCLHEECGNGVVDPAEECDDGNLTAADGCSDTCTTEYCGDGVVGTIFGITERFESGALPARGWTAATPYGWAPETSHFRTGARALGPQNSGVASSTATVTLHEYADGPVCFWYAGESESCCDSFTFSVDGASLLSRAGSYTTWTEFCTDVAAGTHDFVWSYSKDGSVNTGWDAFYIDDLTLPAERTETCDDGNTVGGDGCGPTCLLEECGNGYLDAGEECDDGNLESTDGCSAACRFSLCGDSNVNWSAPSDGFETENLTQLPWSAGAGTNGWAVLRDAAAAHTGRDGLVSGNGGLASTTSWVEIPLTTVADGNVCFWYAGESESCCDHLYFRIDGTTQLTAQGAVAWTEACYAVTAGAHTFRWEYSKDSSVNTGLDRFAIDDVRFPPVLETCDDGNATAGDGCNTNCRVE
jgi:cysteine-rich repeat protein